MLGATSTLRINLLTQQGLSLVELMIAMTLGLLLTLGLTTLFVQNRSHFRQNEDFARMQDSARFALQLISRDLLMAGYWGGVPDGSDIVIDASANSGSGLLDANSCGPGPNNIASGWAFDTTNPIEFLNQDETSNINTIYSCMAQADLAANTDMLAIRRVAGQSTASVAGGATAANLYDNSFYLKANNVVGTVMKTGSGASNHTINNALVPAAAPLDYWRYVVRVYFIQPYTTTVGDGIPSLCRYEIDHAATPSMVKTCLAKGVENLQIQWGIDVGGGGSQIQHTSNPGPGAGQVGDIADVVSARISLLVRGTEFDVGHTDRKVFGMGDITVPAANDNFRRRLYETTVHVRNKPLTP